MSFMDDYAFAVLKLYTKNLCQIYSVSDIARLTGKKYAFVHKKVNELIDLQILRGVAIGRAFLCSLNLDNPIAQSALGLTYAQHHLSWCHNFLGSLRRVFEQSGATTVVYDGHATVYVASFIRNDSLFTTLQSFFATQKESDMRVVLLTHEELMQLMLDDKNLFFNHVVLMNTELFLEQILLHKIFFDQKYNPLYIRGDRV